MTLPGAVLAVVAWGVVCAAAGIQAGRVLERLASADPLRRLLRYLAPGSLLGDVGRLCRTGRWT